MPVSLLKQSAMAVPAFVIVGTSPDGTKAITIGFSGEPRSPDLTATAKLSCFVQFGGGVVGVAAATGALVGAVVGATVAGGFVGAAVGGTAVGVGAGAHAAMIITIKTAAITMYLFMSSPP